MLPPSERWQRNDVDREVLERRVRGAEGEWYERNTVSQDLPRLATDALAAGWVTPSLRVLAGSGHKRAGSREV